MSKNLNPNIQWNDNIDIDKEQWIKLLKDKNIFKPNDIELLKLIYISFDCMATASDLSEKLKLSHYVVVNAQVGRLGKRIAADLNIEAPKYKIGEGNNWWHVPFLGSKEKRKFIWILRPELKEAMNELNNND